MNGLIVVDVSRETLDYLINHVSRETIQFTLKTETNTNYAMFHVKHGVIIYFFGIKGWFFAIPFARGSLILGSCSFS